MSTNSSQQVQQIDSIVFTLIIAIRLEREAQQHTLSVLGVMYVLLSH